MADLGGIQGCEHIVANFHEVDPGTVVNIHDIREYHLINIHIHVCGCHAFHYKLCSALPKNIYLKYCLLDLLEFLLR